MSDRPIPTITNERQFLNGQCREVIRRAEHETDSKLPITIQYDSPFKRRIDPKHSMVTFTGLPHEVIDLIEDFTRRVDKALVA